MDNIVVYIRADLGVVAQVYHTSPRGLRQEKQEFKVSLVYTVKPVLGVRGDCKPADKKQHSNISR